MILLEWLDNHISPVLQTFFTSKELKKYYKTKKNTIFIEKKAFLEKILLNLNY